jgi:hypothetical protein
MWEQWERIHAKPDRRLSQALYRLHKKSSRHGAMNYEQEVSVDSTVILSRQTDMRASTSLSVRSRLVSVSYYNTTLWKKLVGMHVCLAAKFQTAFDMSF